jgi:hypothetical protein
MTAVCFPKTNRPAYHQISRTSISFFSCSGTSSRPDIRQLARHRLPNALGSQSTPHQSLFAPVRLGASEYSLNASVNRTYWNRIRASARAARHVLGRAEPRVGGEDLSTAHQRVISGELGLQAWHPWITSRGGRAWERSILADKGVADHGTDADGI